MIKFQVLLTTLLISIIFKLPLTHHPVMAAEKPVIQVVTENAFPLSYLEDQEIKGYATELLTAIMNDADLDFSISLLPWVRAYQKANHEKNILIYSIGRIPDREQHFKWIGEIVPMSYNLYGLTKNVQGKSISSDEMKNMSIGVTKNDLRYNYLKNHGFNNFVFTSGYAHTHKLLQRGRIDYFIASNWGIEQFKIKYQLKDEDIYLASEFEALVTGLYFAFGEQSDDTLVAKVKTSFNKLVENGTYARIMTPLLNEIMLARQKSVYNHSN